MKHIYQQFQCNKVLLLPQRKAEPIILNFCVCQLHVVFFFSNMCFKLRATPADAVQLVREQGGVFNACKPCEWPHWPWHRISRLVQGASDVVPYFAPRISGWFGVFLSPSINQRAHVVAKANKGSGPSLSLQKIQTVRLSLTRLVTCRWSLSASKEKRRCC